MKFTDYLESKEIASQKEDIKQTFAKIPKKHANLVKDYKIIFQKSNCLKGDDKHIGLIDEKNKTITIAAPWNYGREYTLLHEIGHAVWKYLVSEEAKKEWERLVSKVKKTTKDLNQNNEEIFCMLYAQNYAKNKLIKFDHDELKKFVSKI
jgi:hypothetical protein